MVFGLEVNSHVSGKDTKPPCPILRPEAGASKPLLFLFTSLKINMKYKLHEFL